MQAGTPLSLSWSDLINGEEMGAKDPDCRKGDFALSKS